MEHRCLYFPLWVCNNVDSVCVCVWRTVFSILYYFSFVSFFLLLCAPQHAHAFCSSCCHGYMHCLSSCLFRPPLDAGDHHTGLLSCPPILFSLFVLVVCLQRAGPCLLVAPHAHVGTPFGGSPSCLEMPICWMPVGYRRIAMLAILSALIYVHREQCPLWSVENGNIAVYECLGQVASLVLPCQIEKCSDRCDWLKRAAAQWNNFIDRKRKR